MTDTPDEFVSSTPARASRPSRPDARPPGALSNGIPEADMQIRIAEGADGERLADLQARVLREVTKWQLGQNNSTLGQDDAA